MDTGLAEAGFQPSGILHVSTHLQYCFPAFLTLSPSCPTCLLSSFPTVAELNPAQAQAVKHLDGPSLVIAGAGSGKTRVITAKLLHLIDAGFTGRAIAAITFTNKAAAEMAERFA